jgi:CheY-like chemotaxis protein
MAEATRSRNSGSLGGPRPSFNYLSLSPDDRTWRIKESHQGGSRSGPTILIGEDDDDTRTMFRCLLEPKGYRMVEARDGEQVLDIATHENPGLVLLDLGLPRLNGLSVIRTLRNKLKVIEIPVVVITGHEEHFETAVAAGCDDYLLKPINFEKLDVVLDYYVPLTTHLNVV